MGGLCVCLCGFAFPFGIGGPLTKPPVDLAVKAHVSKLILEGSLVSVPGDIDYQVSAGTKRGSHATFVEWVFTTQLKIF